MVAVVAVLQTRRVLEVAGLAVPVAAVLAAVVDQTLELPEQMDWVAAVVAHKMV
jgi:hypothetical protein